MVSVRFKLTSVAHCPHISSQKNAWTMQLKPVWYESTHVYGMGGENQDGCHSSNFKQFPHSMYHIL